MREAKAPRPGWGLEELIEGFNGANAAPAWVATARATLLAGAGHALLAKAKLVIWLVACRREGKIEFCELAASRGAVEAWQPNTDLPLLRIAGRIPADVAALPRVPHPVWTALDAEGRGPFGNPASRFVTIQTALTVLGGPGAQGGGGHQTNTHMLKKKLEDKGAQAYTQADMQGFDAGAVWPGRNTLWCRIVDLHALYLEYPA